MYTRRLTIAVVGAVAALASLQTADALAATQVTGLTATQRDGFTTLAWTAVAGATDYQIARDPSPCPVDPLLCELNPTVVGLWLPNRTVTPGSPTFADAGFALGGTYQWRVRARIGVTPQTWSAPIVGTTLPQWGTGPGASLRTQWESSGDATYTSDVNEYAYEAALDDQSPRVRMVELGRTNPVTGAPTGRPINMLIIRHPTPLATAQEISDSPTYAVNCNVHGDEPQGRESCLIFARMLAFTQDAHLLDILSQVTVLIVPTMNGNGRAANTRGNETGQDLNRDHAQIAQPETKAIATMVRDYTPEVAFDLHEGDTEDMPILTARHLNVYEPLFNEGKSGLVEGWMYNNAAADGWWMGPYSNGGDSHEGILRNTLGLKNVVGMLGESRPGGGDTRPGETLQLANRNRKSYASLWEEFQGLEYYWTRMPQIHAAIEQSIGFQAANVGRVVLRGSYPWPAFPGVGQPPLPDADPATPARIIDPAPCAYLLTEAQYSGALPAGTVELRLGLHGIAQETRPNGHVVRLAQPLRGLIPTLLDAQAVAPEPMVGGMRLFECPYVTASPRSFSRTLQQGTQTTASFTIGNQAVEVNEDLNWTITEAVSDCSSPSDLTWFSAAQTAGTTTSSSSTNVTLTFTAVGITGPDTRAGVLCLSSNDAGEALITVPLTLDVLSPTAVTIRSFTARRAPAGVKLTWRTAASVGTLGFHVYREQKGKLVKLNRRLIAGGGQVYSWLDRRAPRPTVTVKYRLQVVGLDGTRSWVRSATVGG